MRIPLRTIDDLQQFVDEYQPTVEVVAQIIARKLRVFPDVGAMHCIVSWSIHL